MKPTAAINFAALFGGRTDAYFLSLAKGGRAIWAPVTLTTFARHLEGTQEVGTYPVLDDASCRWGCIDIDMADDEAKAYQLATDVQSVWRFYGVTAWVERSRSKGFHVWTFSRHWVSAQVMRQAGLWVAKVADLDPKTEVNPKNDAPWLTSTGLVNTVRLPYSGRANPGRMVMVDDQGTAIPLEAFISSALPLRAQRTSLLACARSWQQSQAAERYKAQPVSLAGTRKLQGTATTKQEAAKIIHGTTRPAVGERDNQFYTMAKYLHGVGVPIDDALAIIEQRWSEIDNSGFPLGVALEKVRRTYADG